MTEHHPIYETILSGLVPGEEEALAFSEEGRATLADAFRSLDGDAKLPEAVITAVQFSLFLEEQQESPDAAYDMLYVVAEAAGPLLRASGANKAADMLEQSRARLGQAPRKFTPPGAPADGQVRGGAAAAMALRAKASKKK